MGRPVNTSEKTRKDMTKVMRTLNRDEKRVPKFTSVLQTKKEIKISRPGRPPHFMDCRDDDLGVLGWHLMAAVDDDLLATSRKTSQIGL